MAEVEVLVLQREALHRLLDLVVLDERGQETRLGALQGHAVLWTLRAGQRRDDIAEVEVDRFCEQRFRGARPEHALRRRIGFDERDAVVAPVRRIEVVDGLGIDGEEAAGRAIFRRHIRNSGAIGERQAVEAWTIELDEFVHDAELAQHLGHGQHEVGRGSAFLELVGQLEAHDLGQQHGQGLTQHHGLGLDPADAPAQHSQGIDHRGVGIRADQRVRVGNLDRRTLVLLLAGPDRLGQIFEVHLMANAGARGHDPEVRKGFLAPPQEAIALAVALVFQGHVVAERLRGPELVDDDGMVDDEVDRNQRVDLVDVAAELLHRVAHGREVDDGRNTGEILHQHTGRAERDLLFVLAAGGEPGCNRKDVILRDAPAVLVAQQIFEQHLHREGELRHAVEPILFRLRNGEIMVGCGTGFERAAASKTVERGHGASLRSGDKSGMGRI